MLQKIADVKKEFSSIVQEAAAIQEAQKVGSFPQLLKSVKSHDSFEFWAFQKFIVHFSGSSSPVSVTADDCMSIAAENTGAGKLTSNQIINTYIHI